MQRKASGITAGLGILLAIVLIWQYAMPAYQDLTAIAIAEAGLTDGFNFLVFTYLPWWILLCAIARAIWLMIRPKRQ